jgi:FdhD protein
MGVPIIVAMSAPTALAVRTADAAGITLAAIARADGFEVFAHGRRIAPSPPDEMALPADNPRAGD